MYLFVSCSNLNTSHVLINQVLPPPRLPKIKYLNTSHVLINLQENGTGQQQRNI